jgi:hypothetical protein
MNTYKITAIIFACFLVGATAAQTRGPSVNLETTLLKTDPIPLQTGEDADVSFKVTNKGTTTAEDVKVQIMDEYPFKLKPDRKRNYSLGEVNSAESYYISTDILVNEEASDGQHHLKVKITNGDFTRIEKIPLEVQQDDIDINLANLKTTPSQLMPDTENNKLTLSVVNNGDKKAENLNVNLDYPSFFEERSSFSKRQSLGNLEPGKTKEAEFYFDIKENAPKGATEIPATITYTADDSTAEIQKRETFKPYILGKPQYEVVKTSAQLKQGQKAKVEVTVKNKGDEKSTSTRIRALDSSDLPFTYTSSSQFIGTLEPNQSGTAVFEVETESDAERKDYLVDFEIRGVKDTEVFTKDTTLKLEVNGKEKESKTPIIPLTAVLALLLITGAAYILTKKKGEEEKEE